MVTQITRLNNADTSETLPSSFICQYHCSMKTAISNDLFVGVGQHESMNPSNSSNPNAKNPTLTFYNSY
jgi:hypothetical protein